MPMRFEGRAWVSSLRYVVPLVGLFVLARATEGWVGVASWIAFFLLFVVLLVVGVRDTARSWSEREVD